MLGSFETNKTRENRVELYKGMNAATLEAEYNLVARRGRRAEDVRQGPQEGDAGRGRERQERGAGESSDDEAQ